MIRALVSACVLLMGSIPAQMFGEVYSLSKSWQEDRPIHLRLVEDKPFSHPPPLFPTTATEKFDIIEEHAYRVKSMRYQPKLLVEPFKSREEASYADPESAVISFYSAGVNQNYNWFSASWDRAGREKLLMYNRERKKTPADWRKGWEEYYKNKNIYFTSRLESGPYVFIGVQVLRKDGSESGVGNSGILLEIPAVAIKEDGKWISTNSHVGDPVLSYWSSGKKQNVFTRKVQSPFPLKSLSKLENIRTDNPAIPHPRFPTTTPENKEVVRRFVFPVTQVNYEPPVKVKPMSKRENGHALRPEEAAIAHVSAMMKGDYDWWLATWKPKSREVIETDHQSQDSAVADLKRKWAEKFAGKDLYLTSRMETLFRVIIGIRIVSKENQGPSNGQGEHIEEFPVVLRNHPGGWLVTKGFDETPVLAYWRSGKTQTVFRKIIR